MASPVSKKIVKAKGEAPSALEQQIAQAFIELEAGSKDIASELRDLFFSAAKEIDVGASKKAIVIFVPFKLHKRFQKIQLRLIRELEKKFSGKTVSVIAQRTILTKNHSRKVPGAIRARSRTLTKVHEAILEDIGFPTAIVGKSIRVQRNGSHVLKVQLDPKDTKEVDYKLSSFREVYKKLTNKNVEFSFPIEA